jgi:Outer membrane efflux protein
VPTFNLFTTQLNISYSPDVFGGTRRSIEALAAQADSQRFALEATYLILTSNLAGAAIQEASLRGQIMATQSIIKIERDILELLRRQHGLGAIADADGVAQEAALAQAEQTLPTLPSGPSVWTGRALQAESDDLEVMGLALLYPALERNVCVSGHHGYPRALDLIRVSAPKAIWAT